jgi:hypothetical protein
MRATAAGFMPKQFAIQVAQAYVDGFCMFGLGMPGGGQHPEGFAARYAGLDEGSNVNVRGRCETIGQQGSDVRRVAFA